MPDEVFNIWLAPLAGKKGWPFTEVTQDTTRTTWFDTFGGLPLSAWVEARWTMEEIEPRLDLFNLTCQLILVSLAKSLNGPPAAIVANVESTQQRMRACADFIRTNGRLPAPIIILRRRGTLEIVDGNHRMAALFHVGCPLQYLVPAWVPEIENRDVQTSACILRCEARCK